MAYEPAAVEHQAQGDQGTIGPFLFRPASGGFGVPRGGSLEIRIGQIVERNGDRQAEQILDVVEQRASILSWWRTRRSEVR